MFHHLILSDSFFKPFALCFPRRWHSLRKPTFLESSFFSSVHGTGLVALYNNHDVWELLGYEGPSYDKGGYIDRGFNDLDWLPEPRIEEHPELASFLSESPQKLAAIKETIKNY